MARLEDLPLRDNLRGKNPYGAPQEGAPARLNVNENPYPPLPSVLDAIADAAGAVNRYPDMANAELVAAIAEHVGVPADRIACGTGSVGVLGQLVQATCDAGDEVVFAWRSFEAYPIVTTIAGAVPVMVPLTSDARHDLPAMADAITERARLVLVCTPNNPTGPAVTAAELEEQDAAEAGGGSATALRASSLVRLRRPVEGTSVPLDQVPDPTFSQGIMGPGIAIEPSDGLVLAPAEGTVAHVFPTGHAVALTLDPGQRLVVRAGDVGLGIPVGGGDHRLGDQEAGGEFHVVPGGAHGDRERRARDADLQRFLSGEGVDPAHGIASDGDLLHRPPHRDPSHAPDVTPGAAGRGPA